MDREKMETHLIIANDKHYMSPSKTNYDAAEDSLVNRKNRKDIL